MGNLIFLVGAVVLSVVGSTVLWLRHRTPTSVMSSIDGFRQEMSALASDRPSPVPPVTRRPRPVAPPSGGPPHVRPTPPSAPRRSDDPGVGV